MNGNIIMKDSGRSIFDRLLATALVAGMSFVGMAAFGWNYAPVHGETWTGATLINKEVVVKGKDVHLAEGSRLLFRGDGRLHIVGGSFSAESAIIEADGVLTNAFFHVRQSALKLGFAEATDVVENRFTGCKVGIEVVRGQGCRFLGNSLFDGEIGILVSYDEKASVYSGTLFEGLHEAAFKSAAPLSDGTVIANSIFSNCTRRFALADQPEGCKVSVFGTIEKGTM